MAERLICEKVSKEEILKDVRRRIKDSKQR